jgi:hypothetical protein
MGWNGRRDLAVRCALPRWFWAAFVAALASLFGATMVARTALRGPTRVYSVAAAHATLMHAPGQWVERTLYVHGRLDGCPPAPAPCPIWQPRLFDPASATGRGALPVERRLPTSWLPALRRIPLLGALVPAPRTPRWGAVGTYAVRVRAQPITPCPWYRCGGDADLAAFSCDAATCYEALLLDAMP